MDNRFTNTLNTNPVISLIDRDKKAVPRSVFDFSNSKILNGLFGAIIPIDLIHTLPNEDYDIGYDILALSRTPLNRRVLSGCRLFVHTVYQPEGNLWEGAWNQKTGGRSGNIELEKPYVRLFSRSGSSYVDFRTPNSLSDYLGVPICSYKPELGFLNFLGLFGSSSSGYFFNVGDFDEKIDALPFFMYQRLCRDMFFNSNLLINNKAWYPDNEYDFIIPYTFSSNVSLYGVSSRNQSGNWSSSLGNFNNYNNVGTSFSGALNSISAKSTPTNSSIEDLDLQLLRFRQFRGDYFTSALPFPDLIRGDAPVLDVQSISALSDSDLISSVQGKMAFDTTTGTSDFNASLLFNNTDGSAINSTFGSIRIPLKISDTSGLGTVATDLNDYFSIPVTEIASKLIGNNISLSDLRALMVYTLIKQKNALTGGDYNDLVKAHFGVSPKARNYQHTYIGGFYSDMVFNEVFQTSQDNTTPLGTTASRAVSAESGYIGKFHADDYGYIMTVLEIVPEVYYSQGINRNLTKLNREDIYLPETNELSPQAILNKEIYATTDKEYNNDVFGYTERNIEYKTRVNELHGFAALGSLSEFDNALVTKRRFSNKVYLNNDFVTMNPKNVDMSIFSYQQEPPFDLVVKSRIRKVSPIPYISIPGGLDLSLT